MSSTAPAADPALPVPRIFISATTGDLGTVRRAVADGMRGIGALAVEQEYFAPPGMTIADMLEEKIRACQAVIHIAGHRYGAEDENNPLARRAASYADGRRSYTQLEHDLALRHGKRLYVFLCADAFPYDPAPAEPADLAALQQEHRDRLLTSSHFRHSVANGDDLTAQVAKLKDEVHLLAAELTQVSEKVDVLTGSMRRWVLIGSIAAVVIGGGVWWIGKQTGDVKKGVIETKQAVTDVLAENRAIVAKVASLYNETTDLKETLTTEQKFDRAIQRTADAEKLTKGDILARVDSFIASVRAREKEGRADFYDLGLAAFAIKNFTKASEFATQAAATARKDRLEAERNITTATEQKRAATIAERKAETLAGDSEMAAIHFDPATQHYRNAAALYDEKTEPAEWAAAQNDLAMILWRDGKYAEAAGIANDALEARERTLGKEHSDTVTSVNNLALFYDIKGETAKAEPLYLRALEARERTLGGDHSLTLLSVNNLAGLYSDKGETAKAELLYLRALEARERTLGKEHPDTLMTVNNLGGLYADKSETAKAASLYMRAMEARERTLGKDHPDTLMTVNNLATLYYAKGETAKAESLYLRTLEARERMLGRDHPYTLSSVNNLALLYDNKGETAKAEPLFVRALESQERKLGEDHPETLITESNLAGLYLKQGKIAKAESLFLRILEASERTRGKEHPFTLVTVSNLAALYRGKGEAAKAELLFLRALEAQERTQGKDHPNTLTSVNNLAGLYFDNADSAKAESLFLRALEGRERTLGKEHPSTCVTAYNLAYFYNQQGKKERVAELARQAYSGCLKSKGPEHEGTKRAAALLRSLGETP